MTQKFFVTPPPSTPETKQAILAALRAFFEQPPGLDPRNYGSLASYYAEQRAIARDLRDARKLLDAVAASDISATDLLAAAPSTYSKRLSLHWRDDALTVEYQTGQYWPTEYRRAVCAVLAHALWEYVREKHEPPAGVRKGDWLRQYFRREFGHELAHRYFD